MFFFAFCFFFLFLFDKDKSVKNKMINIPIFCAQITKSHSNKKEKRKNKTLLRVCEFKIVKSKYLLCHTNME